MTKMEYAQAVAKEIIGAKVTEVTKDNGVVQTGIVVEMGNVSPTCYIDDQYENGMEVEEVVEGIRRQLATVSGNINVEWLDDWNKVKTHIRVKLMNKATNKHCEVYRSARSYGFDDLILVPYVGDIIVGDDKGTVRVTNVMIESWGVTKRTVIDWGIRNIKEEVMPLAQKLADLVGGTPEMFDSPFVVVSTVDGGTYGAVGIIKAKEQLKQRFPNGYYIIPSSIHEVLILDKETNDPEMLENLVGEVNTEVLEAKDFLSNRVYVA